MFGRIGSFLITRLGGLNSLARLNEDLTLRRDTYVATVEAYTRLHQALADGSMQRVLEGKQTGKPITLDSLNKGSVEEDAVVILSGQELSTVSLGSKERK